MGLRKNVLLILDSLLDQKPIRINGEGNGKILRVANTIIDVMNLNIAELPKVSIIPGPETVETGLLGHIMDSTYRVMIYGYVCKDQNELLFGASEDVIEFIEQTLTDWDNVQIMLENQFSIVQMGPVLNEQYDDLGNIAYISIPLAIQFVQK